MKSYQVYSIDHCPYCERAKALLKTRGKDFDEIKVDRQDTAQVQALVARSGMRTFPQIFHGDKLIGGFTELDKLDQGSGLP